jgi:hypothetical protein
VMVVALIVDAVVVVSARSIGVDDDRLQRIAQRAVGGRLRRRAPRRGALLGRARARSGSHLATAPYDATGHRCPPDAPLASDQAIPFPSRKSASDRRLVMAKVVVGRGAVSVEGRVRWRRSGSTLDVDVDDREGF